MSAGERFNINTFTAATSVLVAQNDTVPSRINAWGGLNISIKGNSNFLGTLTLDNGNGLVDVTSFFTGAASVGGSAPALFYQKSGWLPWKLWLNVQSINGTTVTAVSIV